MVIEEMRLLNFRVYESQSVSFSPNLNLISGLNGGGKTSLVEAVYYACSLDSFRPSKSHLFILNGQNFSNIWATISKDEVFYKVRALLTKQGRQVFFDEKICHKVSDFIRFFLSLHLRLLIQTFFVFLLVIEDVFLIELSLLSHQITFWKFKN